MWQIIFTERFEGWLRGLSDDDRVAVLAVINLLKERGPELPRPHADTVNGSHYTNMKELRIQSQGRPLRAFLRLIRCARALCCAQETKAGRINGFIKT
ncbi:type II toxin-antitoxin system RelE/ParE family toxin [Halorhodospira halochloris]|uniref:type II toxin-antitoxin system RelE/ParE family toxin n=1 Tax=Halorhodospira halochloris TaxID=1052 RepID=UPI001E3CF8F4|nr:type II toxin-antitoxin system RelE/ParE family toxin [Halorhodospira halochloris]